jgi:glycosyltransferase involved in cell wall biosynthesis
MKILILQNKGKSYGGVWQVNKTIGEALIRDGYEVSVVSIRENHTDYDPEHDERMELVTLNPIDDWETYSWTEIIKKFSFSKLKNRLYHIKTMNKDKKKLANYINEYQPDYILSSQYQLLDMIPNKYLKITFNEQHRSFRDSWSHRATRNTFMKYKDKVTFIWLCKKTMEEAIEKGLNNSICIYNAVRFETDKIADVVNNKKLVTIARISKEKRIDEMVSIVEEIFKDKKYSDWTLEIWGDGDEYDKVKSLITSKQVKMMGRTNNPKDILLTSSINLNTSICEGFSLSILEACECGIPTIAFDFGESTEEQILDGKTGFIAKDREDYINKLKKMMDDTKLLKEFSKNSKKYNENFRIENIVKEWEKIFK